MASVTSKYRFIRSLHVLFVEFSDDRTKISSYENFQSQAIRGEKIFCLFVSKRKGVTPRKRCTESFLSFSDNVSYYVDLPK